MISGSFVFYHNTLCFSVFQKEIVDNTFFQTDLTVLTYHFAFCLMMAFPKPRIFQNGESKRALCVNQAQILNAVHESIESNLKLISDQELKGFECLRSYNKRSIFNLCDVIYNDIPQCKNLHSVKRETCSLFSCHKFRLSKKLEKRITAEKKLFRDCGELVSLSQSRSVVITDKIRMFSMRDILHVLHKHPPTDEPNQ